MTTSIRFRIILESFFAFLFNRAFASFFGRDNDVILARKGEKVKYFPQKVDTYGGLRVQYDR